MTAALAPAASLDVADWQARRRAQAGAVLRDADPAGFADNRSRNR